MICLNICLMEYQRYWKLSAAFTCLLSCSIVCHRLLTCSKAHTHNNGNMCLYSNGAGGCDSPSCAGWSKTMEKESALKIFAIYSLFSASGERHCSKISAVSRWQLHRWTPVPLHGACTVAALSSSSVSNYFLTSVSCLFRQILVEAISILWKLELLWASEPQHNLKALPKSIHGRLDPKIQELLSPAPDFFNKVTLVHSPCGTPSFAFTMHWCRWPLGALRHA